LPVLAHADERGTFVVLDREGTTSAVGLDIGMFFIKDVEGVDMGLRENLWGRYVSPMGLGGYAQIAFAQLTGSADTEAAVSDLELGGLYVLAVDGSADVTFRLGFGIPTAPDSGAAVFSNVYTFPIRIHDTALIFPHALWIRPGVGIRAGSRRLFAQLDAGVDIPIKTEDNGPTHVIGHLNGGIGTRQGPVALTLEFATVGSKIVDENDFQFFHNLGVSFRYVEGNVQPFIAYVLPFKFDEEIPGHVLTAGVQGVF
jgi:hypothetical protein